MSPNEPFSCYNHVFIEGYKIFDIYMIYYFTFDSIKKKKNNNKYNRIRTPPLYPTELKPNLPQLNQM